MKTQTLEVKTELEGIEVFYASKEENGSPKTGNGNGDVIIDPNKNSEPIPEGEEEGEGEDRPSKNLKI